MNFETPLKNFEKPLTQQRHVTYKRREASLFVDDFMIKAIHIKHDVVY